MAKRGYHHGDLKAELVRAALAAVEQGGPDAVSLREIAEQLGVSRAAPYRHFADRRALLAEVAALGFADLARAYDKARADAAQPLDALRGTARAYLGLAFGRPGLFRLMFGSDILGADAPLSLQRPARAAWESLRAAVAAADPGADRATINRRTITGWSTLHGFIALVQGERLQAFMTDPLSEAELVEAIIETTLITD
jgi:AcrR family transcriptional regulator